MFHFFHFINYLEDYKITNSKFMTEIYENQELMPFYIFINYVYSNFRSVGFSTNLNLEHLVEKRQRKIITLKTKLYWSLIRGHSYTSFTGVGGGGRARINVDRRFPKSARNILRIFLQLFV